MKTLNVMSLTFTYRAAIRGYESAVLARTWNGIGILDLVISTDIPNADLIQENDILWFDTDTHKAYIVERIETALEGSTEKLYITAKGLESLLADFITVPPSGYAYDSRTGTREAVVRAWVNANCINPTDTDRAQYPIVLGTLQGYGSSITEQTRYKNLADEITRVLATEDLGWGLELDLEGEQFTFEVYQGINRTSGQSTNPRALFGIRYGNISKYHRIWDSLAARTVVYVGGQGEGADRTIVEVEDATAARRREAFMDARDTDASAELTERGQQALAENAAISSFEFETLDRQFTYETDYDLGDYVTIVVDTSTYQHLQITRIQEIYEPGGIRIVPEFGQPQRTLGQILSTTARRVEKLETEGGGGEREIVGPYVSDEIDMVRVLLPSGASFRTSTSSITGAIKITLPVSWTSTMLRFTVKIYDYGIGKSFTVDIAGYNQAASTQWLNASAYITAQPGQDRDFTVRFGHDGSKCCVYIGETSSVWTFPQVSVIDFEGGFIGGISNDTWNDGWDVSFETSFGTITQTVATTQIGKASFFFVEMDGTAFVGTPINEGGDFTVGTDQVTCDFNGFVEVTYRGSFETLNAAGAKEAYVKKNGTNVLKTLFDYTPDETDSWADFPYIVQGIIAVSDGDILTVGLSTGNPEDDDAATPYSNTLTIKRLK